MNDDIKNLDIKIKKIIWDFINDNNIVFMLVNDEYKTIRKDFSTGKGKVITDINDFFNLDLFSTSVTQINWTIDKREEIFKRIQTNLSIKEFELFSHYHHSIISFTSAFNYSIHNNKENAKLLFKNSKGNISKDSHELDVYNRNYKDMLENIYEIYFKKDDFKKDLLSHLNNIKYIFRNKYFGMENQFTLRKFINKYNIDIGQEKEIMPDLYTEKDSVFLENKSKMFNIEIEKKLLYNFFLIDYDIKNFSTEDYYFEIIKIIKNFAVLKLDEEGIKRFEINNGDNIIELLIEIKNDSLITEEKLKDLIILTMKHFTRNELNANKKNSVPIMGNNPDLEIIKNIWNYEIMKDKLEKTLPKNQKERNKMKI